MSDNIVSYLEELKIIDGYAEEFLSAAVPPIDKSEKTHIVFYSGGIGSFGAAYRLVKSGIPKEKIVLLFTDTKMEDIDLYRFLKETTSFLGIPITYLADGRNPWEIFFKVRFLGNSRIDPCSKILKRDLARRWITKTFEPDECILYLGIDWTESHRWERSKRYWEPYQVDAPLCHEPYTSKQDLFTILEENGIKKPRLYDLGFAHNNCFTPDTEIITDKGIKSLKDILGQPIQVMNVLGKWESATVKSFGKQKIVNLKVSKYNQDTTIQTTKNHRWLRQGLSSDDYEVVETMDLKVGDLLVPSFKVLSVDETDLECDVMCPVTEYTHTFTLANGLVTGNCGGFCIKSGQAQFKKLLEHFPEKYKYHEEMEKKIGEMLGKPVTMLKKTTKGVTSRYSLEQLRKDVQGDKEIDETDFGGCGCMLEDNEETDQICSDV